MARQPKTSVASPFTVIIDTAEQHPFSFTGLKSDARENYLPIKVETVFECLGRHPNSLGDYSIVGGVGSVHVERKSLEDAQGTILGFDDGRRDRFEQELANLAIVEAAIVVVECSLSELLASAPEFGKKTKQQNAKTLFRSILAFQQDYRVPWLFAGSRAMAEQATYRFFYRWYEKKRIKAKAVKQPSYAAVEKGLF